MPVQTHDVSTNWTPLPRYIFRKKNIMHELKKLDNPKTFIDVGCGAGELACSLAEEGLTGTGYDFSEKAIAVCNSIKNQRELSDDQVKFVHSTKGLDTMTDTADIILSMEVLEHIKEDTAAFAELVRLSNRYVIISVPAKQKLFSHSDELAGHYRRYDKAELDAMIGDSPVKLIKRMQYGYPFTDLFRLLRERQSKTHMDDHAEDSAESKEKLSEQSGIHIYEVNPNINKLRLETLLTPFYWMSRLFNGFNLSEGHLLIFEKTDQSK